MSDQAPALFEETRCRAYAIAALVPFFTADAGEATAEAIATELLDEYQATAPRQIQLAAEVIALGWATLACLGASATMGLEPMAMLALQDEALRLERMTRRANKALEASRKGTAAETGWDEGAFQLTINRAMEAMGRANRRLGRVPEEPEVVPMPKRTRRRGVRAGRPG